MDLKHQLLADLKRIAADLGRIPTRDEFVALSQYSKRQLVNAFGGFTTLKHAAGATGEKPEKKDPFSVSVTDQLNKYKSKRSVALYEYEETIIFGDLHLPWVHVDALSTAYALVEKLKPKRCIQVGDLYDMYAWSKFPRSLNVYTPRDEITLARKMAEHFWSTIQKLSPGIECYLIRGNHCIRPIKRVIENAPELEIFLEYDKYFLFDGVKTILDPREELILGDAAVIHGYRTKLGDHRDYMRMNVICGHTHRGGVSYKNINGKTLWELNAGYLADPSSKALGYTPQRIVEWTLGVGWLDALGPRFIAF